MRPEFYDVHDWTVLDNEYWCLLLLVRYWIKDLVDLAFYSHLEKILYLNNLLLISVNLPNARGV